MSVDKTNAVPQSIHSNISSENMPDAYYNLENDENIEAALVNRDNLRHRWTTEETKLLLSLYLVKSGPLNKRKVTHSCFWNEISTKMRENGYAFTAPQCNRKLENLKKLYKKCDHNRQSGNNPKTMEHYDILQEIFSKIPWIEPLSTAGSSTSLGQHLSEKPSSSGLKCCVASDKTEYVKELLQLKKQKLQDDKEYKQEKLKILKDIRNKLSFN